tara:strand:- start:4446 stop:4799 length:354 start_codon:yes stop_codon:yes gene_type:complete
MNTLPKVVLLELTKKFDTTSVVNDEVMFCKQYELQNEIYHDNDDFKKYSIYGRVVKKCLECNFWRDVEDDDSCVDGNSCIRCLDQQHCKSCDKELYNSCDWEEFPYCNNKNCKEYGN